MRVGCAGVVLALGLPWLFYIAWSLLPPWIVLPLAVLSLLALAWAFSSPGKGRGRLVPILGGMGLLLVALAFYALTRIILSGYELGMVFGGGLVMLVSLPLGVAALVLAWRLRWRAS